jgi:methionine salvage enolase-phosphatase E1
MWFDELVSKFSSWRTSMLDMSVYDRGDMNTLFGPYIETKRGSKRPTPKQNSVSMQRIIGLKRDSLDLLAFLKEENNAAATMVEIGSV